MSIIRRGLFVSLGERYVIIAIQLAGMILLARLLTPEEIGIYSVNVAIIGIAQVMRDFGISNFLVQERQLSESHIRTAFGFSLIIGIALFIVAFSAAPLAGQFYADPRLTDTMRISAYNFLLLPFCSISLALLRRDMRFKRLAAVNLAAAFIAFAVGISLAYAGFGSNSMAFAAISANIVTGSMAWLLRSGSKLLLPSLSEWRAIIRFGSQNSAANIASAISVDINDLALGKILGFAPVAIISRAQGVMNIFHRDIMNAVRGVMFPAFANAHREGQSVDAQYIKSVTTVTAFAWPFYGFAALYAHELVRLMFGPQWDEAAALVPWFCLAGAFAATSNLLLNAVMAVGRIDLVTRAELTIQPIRALVLVCTAIIFESLLACAIAFLLIFAAFTPFLYKIKDKCMPTDYGELSAGLLASGKLAAVTLAVPAILVLQSPTQGDLGERYLMLASAAALSGVSWLLGICFLNHPLKAEPIIQRVLRFLSPKT